MTISSDEDEYHYVENKLALASAQMKQQKYSEAIQNLKKARKPSLASKKLKMKSFFGEAKCQEKLERKEEAIKTLKKVVLLEEDHF